MKFRLALLLCLIPMLAWGQQYIQQSGNVTGGHVPVVVTSGIVQDGGPATAGNITEVGIVKNGGLPLCIATALAPPRQLYCFSISDTLGTITLNSYGEAAATFAIVVNGVSYPFPGPPYTISQLRTVSSGDSDSATSLDGTIVWDSSDAAAKTETLYSCNSGAKANKLVFKDQYGSAGAYPIVLTPNGSDTIDGLSLYYMSFNFQGVTLQCNGSGAWLAE